MILTVKYIHSKGDLQNGDTAIITMGNENVPVIFSKDDNETIKVNPFDEDLVIEDHRTLIPKKVKICLCSDELSIGDMCVNANDSPPIEQRIVAIEGDNIALEQAPNVFLPAKDHYRIVAVISDQARWVREGQTYQISQIKFLKCSTLNGDTDIYDEVVDKNYNRKKWFLLALLKCPYCRHWH